jgi:hypothetical protein
MLAWSSTWPEISRARRTLVAALSLQVLSPSWHRTRTAAGGRACCIASRTNCGDGEFPLASLIFDQAGNL